MENSLEAGERGLPSRKDTQVTAIPWKSLKVTQTKKNYTLLHKNTLWPYITSEVEKSTNIFLFGVFNRALLSVVINR